MTGLVRRIAREEVGEHGVIEGEQHMGADDAGLFLAERAGCYFFVGTANPAVAPAGRTTVRSSGWTRRACRSRRASCCARCWPSCAASASSTA